MKKNEISKAILTSLAVAGGLVVLAALPGLAVAFAPFIKSERKFSPKQLKRSMDQLKNSGFLGISKEGDKTVLRLTKLGHKKVLKYNLDAMTIVPQKRWDKKWRIVIFDIPEKFKQGRDALTAKLKELGFIRIQKSVWVCPYPCEDEVDFVSEIYEVRQFTRMIIAEKLDKQESLQKAYSLVK